MLLLPAVSLVAFAVCVVKRLSQKEEKKKKKKIKVEEKFSLQCTYLSRNFSFSVKLLTKYPSQGREITEKS